MLWNPDQPGSIHEAARRIRAILDRGSASARRTAQGGDKDDSAVPTPPVKPPPPWHQDDRATRIIEEILGWEGGAWDDPRAGRTNNAITKSAIKEWNRLAASGRIFGDPGDLPNDPYQLDRDQAFRILKQVYYDQLNLADIGDEKLAHQLADIGINSSPKGLAHIVNSAANEVMRQQSFFDSERLPASPGILVPEKSDADKRTWYTSPTRYNGDTISRLNMLIDNGFGKDLRNEIVRQRFAYAKSLANYDDSPGWRDRFLRFVESSQSPRDDRPQP